MALTNLGFETAGVGAGAAASWTRFDLTTAERRAVWGTGSIVVDDESFESEWDTNQDYLFEYDNPLTQIQTAIFDTGIGATDGPEDFEDGWDSNQSYLFTLGANIEAAVFDGEMREDFEDGWDSNESYSFTLPATATAMFDSAPPEGKEDFEEQWDTNESYSYTLGGATAAVFTAGFSTDPFEAFEDNYTERAFTVTPATDVINLTSHGFLTSEPLFFRVVGTGVLPGGLGSGVPFYLTSMTINTFQVSTTSGGPDVDITNNGAGTHYVSRSPTRYWIVRIDTPLGI